MPYIGHRCQTCGHRQAEHYDGEKPVPCHQTAGCGCPGFVTDEPELIKTFGIRGRTLDLIVPPGELIAPGLHACPCTSCRALYEQLTTEQDNNGQEQPQVAAVAGGGA